MSPTFIALCILAVVGALCLGFFVWLAWFWLLDNYLGRYTSAVATWWRWTPIGQDLQILGLWRAIRKYRRSGELTPYKIRFVREVLDEKQWTPDRWRTLSLMLDVAERDLEQEEVALFERHAHTP